MTERAGAGARIRKHWSDLAKVARSTLHPADPIWGKLENNGVSRSCDDLLLLFDPIANSLNTMQSPSATISEAIEIWLQMLSKIPRDHSAFPIVFERSKQALECPFFLLANILDPRFRGSNLTPTQIDKARHFAEQEGPEVARALTLYLSGTEPFRSSLFDSQAEPIPWWKAGERSGLPPKLCDLALRLSGCLASTANLERNFSTLGNVFGTRRTWGGEGWQAHFPFPCPQRSL